MVLLGAITLMVSSGCTSVGGAGGGGSSATTDGANPSTRDLERPSAARLGGDGFVLTDFEVDEAHQNPFAPDPHEAFLPDFNNFQLTIFGEFDDTKCYQVKIARNGASDGCGSANNSGSDDAIVTATTLFVDISPQAEADFKAAADWEIEVTERQGSGCTGGKATQIMLGLSIAGCNVECDPSGSGEECDDGDACTVDFCREEDWLCVNLPDPAICDDGNACTEDSCDPVTGCTNEPVDCSALGDECNAASCDPSGEPGNCDVLTPLSPGTPCGSGSGTDCDDPDTCDGFGSCLDNYEPIGTACSDDGDECTVDQCDGAGTCEHPDAPAGTPCGDDTFTECDNPDTCDGSGDCQDNYQPTGTACGSDEDDECDDPDTCDGVGGCLPNYEASGVACPDDGDECTADECDGAGSCDHPYASAGTACGDQSSSDCDDPDTCDGSGDCQDNPLPDGTSCQDGDPCTDPDECLSGECAAGAPVPDCCDQPDDPRCDDLIACTTDWCDLDSHTCESELDPGYCLIDGVCYQDGDENPANECEVCNSSLDTEAWSPRPAGTACTEDAFECTADECDGDGSCTHPNEPVGTPCGDGTDPHTADEDTGAGAGTCQDN